MSVCHTFSKLNGVLVIAMPLLCLCESNAPECNHVQWMWTGKTVGKEEEKRRSTNGKELLEHFGE